MKYDKTEAAAPGGPESLSDDCSRHREREEASLKAAGFEREEGTELWVKGNLYFGREAALQKAACSRPGQL